MGKEGGKEGRREVGRECLCVLEAMRKALNEVLWFVCLCN